MNENFVVYKESLSLREIGFNEKCFGVHTHVGGSNDEPEIRLITIDQPSSDGCRGLVCNSNLSNDNVSVTAPLLSQAFKYLRDRGMYGIITPSEIVIGKYNIRILHSDGKTTVLSYKKGKFLTLNYEMAERTLLTQLIYLFKNS